MHIVDKLKLGIPDGEGMAYAVIAMQEAHDEIERLLKILREIKVKAGNAEFTPIRKA